MNTNIPSPRADFIDERTPNKISREWFAFLYEMFQRLGGSSGSVTIEDIEAMFQSSPAPTLPPVSFIDSSPRPALVDQSFVPRPFVGIDPVHEHEFLRLQASLDQLRQEMRDGHSLVELAPAAMPEIGTGSDVTLDCDTLETIGYWSPVTDGSSNIIYSGGQVVVAFTCTS